MTNYKAISRPFPGDSPLLVVLFPSIASHIIYRLNPINDIAASGYPEGISQPDSLPIKTAILLRENGQYPPDVQALA